MQRSLTTLLHARRAAVKTEWNRGLWAEPQTALMANPEMLSCLMEETLDQLERLLPLRPTSRWSSLYNVHLAPLYALSSCGLNLLLVYFSAGGEALKHPLSAGRLSDAERNRLDGTWHYIAQSEIQALCGHCHSICAPSLSFSLIRSSIGLSGQPRAPRARKPLAC